MINIYIYEWTSSKSMDLLADKKLQAYNFNDFCAFLDDVQSWFQEMGVNCAMKRNNGDITFADNASLQCSVSMQTLDSCQGLFNTPLDHAHHLNNTWIPLKSTGDVLDYLVLHVCPALTLPRMLVYISSLNRLITSMPLDINYTGDAFEVLNKNNNKKVTLTYDGAVGRLDLHLQHHTRTLHNILDHVDLELDKDIDLLEYAFAGFQKPQCIIHPANKKNLRIVLGLLDLNIIYDAMPSQE